MPASGSLLSLALAHSPPGGLCARGRSSQHRHPPRTPGQGSLQAAKDFQTGQFPSNLLSVLPKRHCGSRPPGRAVSSAVGKTQGSLGTGSPRGTQLPKPPPRVACDITETYSKETRTAVLSDSGEEKPPATCSIQIRRDLQDVGRSRGRGQGRWGTAPPHLPARAPLPLQRAELTSQLLWGVLGHTRLHRHHFRYPGPGRSGQVWELNADSDPALSSPQFYRAQGPVPLHWDWTDIGVGGIPRQL